MLSSLDSSKWHDSDTPPTKKKEIGNMNNLYHDLRFIFIIFELPTGWLNEIVSVNPEFRCLLFDMVKIIGNYMACDYMYPATG